MLDWEKLVFPYRQGTMGYVVDKIIDSLNDDDDSSSDEYTHNEKISRESRAQEVKRKMELLQDNLALIKTSITEKKNEIEEAKIDLNTTFEKRLQYVLEMKAAQNLSVIKKVQKNPGLYLDHLNEFQNDVKDEITRNNERQLIQDYEEIDKINKELESIYSKKQGNN